MKLTYVIEKPIVTEKSIKEAESGKYTFKVKLTATKGAIAKEVKSSFGVDAVSVNTSVVPGKPKRVMGKREFVKLPKWKRAIVKLKEGQSIDLFAQK